MKNCHKAVAMMAAVILSACPAFADTPIPLLPPTPLDSSNVCGGGSQILSYSATPQGSGISGINCTPVTTDTQGDMTASGYVQAGNSSASCNPSRAGAIRFNSSAPDFEGCNGASWQPIGSSGFPKNHGVITANAQRTSCSGYTDGNGNVYLSSSDITYGSWVQTHILISSGCSGQNICMTYLCLADTTGITSYRDGDFDSGFAAW